MENNLDNKNFILTTDSLPSYGLFTPEVAESLIDSCINDGKSVFKKICDSNFEQSWDSTILPLTISSEKLSRVWSATHHLSGVIDSPEWRSVIRKKNVEVTDFWTQIGQSAKLANKTKKLINHTSVKNNKNRVKVIENSIRDFTLGGATLSKKEKKIFGEYESKLATLSQKFSENVMDSTKASYVHIPENSEIKKRLAGLPSDVVFQAKENAKSLSLTGARFTLLAPSLIPVLQFSKDRALRFSIYSRHARKASEISEEGGKFDNGSIISEILRLRYAKAQLLGFKTPAEMSLATKMANNPKEVTNFLLKLAKKAKPSALADFENLKKFAKSDLKLNEIEAWDFAFASEELRKKQFNYSEEELKQYFPLNTVLEGMFKISNNLFGCEIQEIKSKVKKHIWHKDVSIYEIKMQRKIIGHLYLDLFARDTKRSGAWMDDSRGRHLINGNLQTPIALLNCNFSKPTGNELSYLSHDELLTLFHEFGHGLHHLMTQVDEIDISGINGVEWDAVELPSQFLENFCWEYKNLKSLSKHKNSGKPISLALFNKISKAKNFQSGLQMLRQIEFSLFDIRIHQEIENIDKMTNDEIINEVYRIQEETRDQISVIKPPKFQRFPQSFSHIFAGGYSAGYYSYKWAEVLSADCYSVFENKSLSKQSILGKKFLEHILSKGGSRPSIESFKKFMNRKPNADALLKNSGLVPSKKIS